MLEDGICSCINSLLLGCFIAIAAAAVAAAAQAYADRLAEECAAAPLQWFNFYDFWNDYG